MWPFKKKKFNYWTDPDWEEDVAGGDVTDVQGLPIKEWVDGYLPLTGIFKFKFRNKKTGEIKDIERSGLL